ncbi:hypothetical protein SNEBB_004227 [Seison nebaliae]|nr:hypothetical protein SNEBB_004227 [Seison nebaliae]
MDPLVGIDLSKEIEQKYNARTFTVEKIINPLIKKVESLIRHGLAKGNRIDAKKPKELVLLINEAIGELVKKGEEIADENLEMKGIILEAVTTLKENGEVMSIRSLRFAEQPTIEQLHQEMVDSAQVLLNNVIELLSLADDLDVQRILKLIRECQMYVEQMKMSSNADEMIQSHNCYSSFLKRLLYRCYLREADLKVELASDELAASRSYLKMNSPTLLTSCRAYLRHPELTSARKVREIALSETFGALDAMERTIRFQRIPMPVSMGTNSSQINSTYMPIQTFSDNCGQLYLDQIDLIRSLRSTEQYTKEKCEELEMESEQIISSIASIADDCSTREERRDKIVAESNYLRQLLQDILRKSVNENERLNQMKELHSVMSSLHNELRRGIADQVSDLFGTNDLLLMVDELVNYALKSPTSNIGTDMIDEQLKRMFIILNNACNVNDRGDGNRLCQMAFHRLDMTIKQLLSSIQTLIVRPKSKVAQENVSGWRTNLSSLYKTFVRAIDGIVNIHDFLAITESHIWEDVHHIVRCLEEGNVEGIRRNAMLIRGRALRSANIVNEEVLFNNVDIKRLNNQSKLDTYKLTTVSCVKLIHGDIIKEFDECVELGCRSLYETQDGPLPHIHNNFIASACSVYDHIRDMRRAVRAWDALEHGDLATAEAVFEEDEEDDDPNENEEEEDDDDDDNNETDQLNTSLQSYNNNCINQKNENEKKSKMTAEEKHDIVEGTGKTTRQILADLPSAEREKITEQVKGFREERRKFEREVLRWDEKGNDIISLAKKMCIIMMEMTDFTRGKGPLRTTMDVINAAKTISDYGTQLDRLAKEVATNCPESASKKDLLAYLDRIALYCQQLKICSRVKADVQNVSGELIVSGLDSATSLIQAAKNLMNAVVLTVKASYVASTKYVVKKDLNGPCVQWRMKIPDKKPLVWPTQQDESQQQQQHPRSRKMSEKRRNEPITILNDFQY